jgi:hypothetical protein
MFDQKIIFSTLLGGILLFAITEYVLRPNLEKKSNERTY